METNHNPGQRIMCMERPLVNIISDVWRTGQKMNAKKRFGVFFWNERGEYPEEMAIRLYERIDAAQRYCDKENEDHPEYGRKGLVVRTVYLAP